MILPVPAGYQVGVLNTALPFIAKDLHYHKQGVLSSAVVLGAAAGAITAGKLADTLGPRHAQVCWAKHHVRLLPFLPSCKHMPFRFKDDEAHSCSDFGGDERFAADAPCLKQLAAWQGMPNNPLIIVFKPAAAQHSILYTAQQGNNSSTFIYAELLVSKEFWPLTWRSKGAEQRTKNHTSIACVANPR